VSAERVGAGPFLDGVAELLLDLLALGLQRVELEARPRLQQREHAVAVIAHGLAEVAAAVAGGAGVHERLEHEVLLAGLPPEQRGVVGVGDVEDDVGVELLELDDDRRHVVDRLEVVVLDGRDDLQPDFLGPGHRGLGDAWPYGGVLREERDLQLARLQVEARRQVLDDEVDVVPAEPGGVDLVR
jgi:hypothetical protein